MSNRWFRFVIAVLALAAAGAAGYRIHQHELRRSDDVAAARTAAASAERSLVHVSELKAALHAYVAAGQGHAFWTGRAGMLIDGLRAAVLDVDKAAAALGAAPTEALDLIDRLAASEQRAREHVRASEELMASDIIFTESRDLLDALRIQIARTRDHMAQTADGRQAALRQEQLMMAAGAAGLMALAVLILVPTGRDRPEASAPLSVTAAPARSNSEETVGYGPGVAVSRPRPDSKAAAAPASKSPSLSIAEAARLCTDLGRIADSAELTKLLDRAGGVLGASGIIVWMASADRRELFPAAASGYDARLLSRVGAIAHDSANLTAAAFREGAAKTSDKAGSSAAALAVPLVGPNGPVGVLSAELKEASDVGSERLALATIFAAQLATLLGSMTPAQPQVPAQQVQA